MRTLLILTLAGLLSGCGNMYFSPRTSTGFVPSGDGFVFSTISDLDSAPTCLANVAIRYCAVNAKAGASISYVPSDEPSSPYKAKANVTCSGPIDQKLLDMALNSGC